MPVNVPRSSAARLLSIIFPGVEPHSVSDCIIPPVGVLGIFFSDALYRRLPGGLLESGWSSALVDIIMGIP